jgi:hypothetical protein
LLKFREFLLEIPHLLVSNTPIETNIPIKLKVEPKSDLVAEFTPKTHVFDLEFELKHDLSKDEFIEFILDYIYGKPYKEKKGRVVTVTDEFRIPFFITLMNNMTFNAQIEFKYEKEIKEGEIKAIDIIKNSFKNYVIENYKDGEKVWEEIVKKLKN